MTTRQQKVERITTNDELPENNLTLPNTPEDGLETLDIWGKAVALHERGLTWTQVAAELISGGEKKPLKNKKSKY